jgi:hypothetical protein
VARDEAKGQRLVALFILGCLLFNYPVLSLFNLPADALGVPLLYVFIFAAWAVLVALMAVAVER